MKVKYIRKSDVSLTNGKIYEVLAIERGLYRIVDDTEEDYLFYPEEFEIVEEQSRALCETKCRKRECTAIIYRLRTISDVFGSPEQKELLEYPADIRRL